MLNPTPPSRARCGAPRPARQRGIVLIVALIVLVAMSLAAIGLMRSSLTSNRIAGNLAFQQAATQSAEIGIETAIAWLEANNSGTTLHDHIAVDGTHPVGYFASRQDPAPGQSWEAFWEAVLVPSGRVTTLPADAAGNTVSFVIQRLCNATGDPASGIGCEVAPASVTAEGNSKGSGVVALLAPSQSYYRISARVVGPRNTVGFVQAVVAL